MFRPSAAATQDGDDDDDDDEEGDEGEVDMQEGIYDFVVVANGHYEQPHWPSSSSSSLPPNHRRCHNKNVEGGQQQQQQQEKEHLLDTFLGLGLDEEEAKKGARTFPGKVTERK
jgi:hypothetical protein